jgi:hypothetical protein
MVKYINPQDIWDYLGKNAFTKVRSEAVGTGNDTLSAFSVPNDNLISTSVAVYTDSTQVTSGVSVDYDDGELTFDSAPTSGVVVSIDYNYSDMQDSAVKDLINQSEEELETMTGRTFESSSATEYLDVRFLQDEFFLKNYPVLGITSIARNTAAETDTPVWETLSQGLGSDYLVESSSSQISFIDNKPENGKRKIKAVYNYGFATPPNLAKELDILLCVKRMVNSAVFKSVSEGNNSLGAIDIERMDSRIKEINLLLRKQNLEVV